MEVELGVGERRPVLRLFRLGLVERGLERAGIDLRQQVAGLDHLALIEGDLGDLAVDAGANRDGVLGLDLAEPVDIDRIIGALRRRNGNGHRP